MKNVCFMKSLCNTWKVYETNFVYDLATLLIGLLSSLIWAVLPAPLHYRALQRLKHRALNSLGSWDLQVSLDSSSQNDLVFWVSQLKEHNGRSLESPIATMIVSSNASRLGWGTYSSISSVGGHWSPVEQVLHINALELKAAFLALESLVSHQHFLSGRALESSRTGPHINALEMKAAFLALESLTSHQRDCHILLLLDNITAISFIINKGGYKITCLFRPGTGNMDLVPVGGITYMQSIYQAPAIKRRTGFHTILRIKRLEAGPLFSEISESLGPVWHRLVRG